MGSSSPERSASKASNCSWQASAPSAGEPLGEIWDVREVLLVWVLFVLLSLFVAYLVCLFICLFP